MEYRGYKINSVCCEYFAYPIGTMPTAKNIIDPLPRGNERGEEAAINLIKGAIDAKLNGRNKSVNADILKSTFIKIQNFDEWDDYELREYGRNANCRSIVLTLEHGEPVYAYVYRSKTPDSELGAKAEFELGKKAFSALVGLWNQQSIIKANVA